MSCKGLSFIQLVAARRRVFSFLMAATPLRPVANMWAPQPKRGTGRQGQRPPQQQACEAMPGVPDSVAKLSPAGAAARLRARTIRTRADMESTANRAVSAYNKLLEQQRKQAAAGETGTEGDE